MSWTSLLWMTVLIGNRTMVGTLVLFSDDNPKNHQNLHYEEETTIQQPFGGLSTKLVREREVHIDLLTPSLSTKERLRPVTQMTTLDDPGSQFVETKNFRICYQFVPSAAPAPGPIAFAAKPKAAPKPKPKQLSISAFVQRWCMGCQA